MRAVRGTCGGHWACFAEPAVGERVLCLPGLGPLNTVRQTALTGTTPTRTEGQLKSLPPDKVRYRHTDMLNRIEFGSEALGYLKDRLAHGRQLAKELLHLPLEGGLLFTYLPEGVDREAAGRFEAAGPGAGSEMEIEQHIADFASAYLEPSPKACAVFEHALANPTDAFLSAQSGDVVFFHNTDVYYLATRDGPPVLQALRRAKTAYLCVGALTAVAGVPAIRNRLHVSGEAIAALARNTNYILVSAYDLEGYLIWSREQAPADAAHIGT